MSMIDKTMKVGLTRRDWGVILVLAAVNFLHIVDFVIIMPLGDQLMRELQLNPAQFGYIVSAYAVCAMIATLAASFVIDRFDRKTVLIVAFSGFGLSTLFCGLAGDYQTLLMARGLAGVFGGLSAGAIMAVIGDHFADARRGTAMGAVMSAFAVASSVGLPLGLWMANNLGRGAPFVAIAVLSIPVVIAVGIWLPSMRDHRTPGRLHSPVADFAAVVATPRHLISFAFMFALVMGTFTIIPFLAPYMQRNAGRPPEDIPIIYLVAGICTLFSMNVIGRMTDSYGKRPVFRVMALMALIMTLILTNLPVVSVAIAVITASLFMVSASGRMVPAQALMLATATPGVRGAFVNINSAVQHLAMSVAPTISGAIMGGGKDQPLTGYSEVGYVAGGFAVLSLVLAEFIRPAPITSASQISDAAVEVEAVLV